MDQGDDTERAPSPIVLRTKLHIPTPRRELLARPPLLERLRAGPLPALTLVDAPPGWGKSTLLAQWCATDTSRRFAWLSVDPGDSDPVRFWSHAIEALRTVEPSVGRTALDVLRTPGAGIVEVVLPSLLNDLGIVEGELVLVLDDYHLAANPEIHSAMGFLIDQLPVSVRLVMAVRNDPPLPLSQLRARGELREIRMAQLRFSPDEAAILMNELLGLRLPPDDVVRLHERTEGWAAGLYLAALSLREHRDPHGFVQAFAGDDRNVVDFLSEEVIDRQLDDVRAFLVRTSVLDRLSGGLCDAVLQREDSSAMLERLERHNLFLIPLDTRRRWYRYHHLFGELLAHELRRTEPRLVPELHRRASAWYREQGSVAQAIRHAIAAGDVGDAGRLVAVHWNDFVNQGRAETVHRWLDALPDEALRADPHLCLAAAGTALTTGRRDEVDGWLELALRHPDVPPVRPDGTSVEAEATIYRALHRTMLGDLSPAVKAGRWAVALERESSSPWGAMAYAALGRPLYWLGEAAEAAGAFRQAIERADPPRNNLSIIASLGYLATIEAEAGNHDTAKDLAARAVEISERDGLAEHWVGLMALVGRAHADVAAGRLDDAERAASRATTLGRRGVGAVEMARALLALASVRAARGDAAAAHTALAEAGDAIARCPDPGMLPGRLHELERRMRGAPRLDLDAADVPIESLTERELVVLRLLDGPLSLREIGKELFVSLNTVKTHTRGIYRKLGVAGRPDAVERARGLGLL